MTEDDYPSDAEALSQVEGTVRAVGVALDAEDTLVGVNPEGETFDVTYRIPLESLSDLPDVSVADIGDGSRASTDN